MCRCEMTVEDTSGCVDTYFKCGKPAKFITPNDPPNKQMNVCGIHKNSVDSMYKKRKDERRCVAI